MVYQVGTGTIVAGREIKVPQTYIGRVLRAVILSSTPANDVILNVLHFVAPSTPVIDSDVATVATLVSEWCSSDYAGVVSSSIRFESVYVRSMEGADVPALTVPLSPLIGSVTGVMMPASITLAIELTTARTLRRNRGMLYLFPTGKDYDIGIGIPDSTYINSALGAMNALVGNATDAGYPMVVAQFETQTFRVIRAVTCKQRWGSQDRREVGHN